MASSAPSSTGSQIFNEKGGQNQQPTPVASSDYEEKLNNHRRNFHGDTGDHPFNSSAKAAYWDNVYKNARYEGAHRYDPAVEWTQAEEKKLTRKVHFLIHGSRPRWLDRLIFVSCVGCGLCSHRWILFEETSIEQSLIIWWVGYQDHMCMWLIQTQLKELGMNTNDFNTGQTIYLASFLIAELPVGLISKRVGPDIMTPITICTWGIICSFQSMIQNRTGFFVTRCLLGIAQGGFIPEMVLYLTYWYKSNELPIRLSFYWTAIPITQIIGALLAAGILLMRGIAGLSGWRWL